MYDWKGRWIEQDDDDEPTLRRHCACGAFLPTKPREIATAIPTEVDTTYNEQGEVIAITVLKEEKDVEWVWTCTKCGREYDSDEMYK